MGLRTGAGPWRVRYQAAYFPDEILFNIFVTLNSIAFGRFMKKKI